MDSELKTPVSKYDVVITDSFPRVNQSYSFEGSIEQRDTVCISPSNAATQDVNASYCEFRCDGVPQRFLDLSSIKLEVLGECVKGANTALEDADGILLVDNTLHSLFKSVSVFLNGKQVENNTMYPLLSHLKTVIETSPHKKGRLLANSKYWGNSHSYESLTEGTALTGDLLAQSTKQKEGKIQMIGNLMLDLSTVDQYLLDSVNVVIRLEYAPDAFVMSTNKPTSSPKFKIEDLKLYIDRLKPYANAMTALNETLNGGASVDYVYNKTLVKTAIIPTNSSTLTLDNPFLQVIPNRITMCLLDLNAYNGQYLKNALYIKSCGLTHLTVTVNNRQFYNISTNPTEHNAVLYDQVIKAIGPEDGLLTKEMFDKGACIIALEMSPERVGDALSLDVIGHLRVAIEFAGVPGNTMCVLVGETTGLVKIDKFRQISMDTYT